MKKLRRKPGNVAQLTFPKEYKAPDFNDAFWADAESILKVKLHKNIRKQIENIFISYIQDAGHESDGANTFSILNQHKKDGLTKFARFQKAAKEMQELYREMLEDKNFENILYTLDTEIDAVTTSNPRKEELYQRLSKGKISLKEHQELEKLIETSQISRITLKGAMHKVFIINDALKNFRNRESVRIAVKGAKSTKGKSVPDPYLIYVRKILNVLKTTGIKITKSKPTGTTKKPQIEDLFLERLNKELPDNIQKPVRSYDAWAQDRCLALK